MIQHRPSFPTLWLALLIAAGASCVSAVAQPTPLEDPVRVNQTLTDNQVDPAVARSADGSFVVVWIDDSTPASSVVLRRFAADGSPLGPETPVFQPVSGWSASPSVAVDTSGNALVAWSAYDDSALLYRVYGRTFDPDGVPLNSPFLVSASTTDSQSSATVTATAAGTFVVAWDTDYSTGVPPAAWARPFDASGSAQAPAFQLAPESAVSYEPALTPSGADAVAAAYISSEPGTSTQAVEVRRFAPDGSSLDTPFVVAEDEGYGVFTPAIQSGGRDDFVVAWGLETSFPHLTVPMVEVVGPDGTPRSDAVQVGYDTFSRIHVARADDGTFIAVWDFLDGALARAFGPTAEPVGATLVLGDPGHTSGHPGLALDSLGNPVFVFSAWTDDSSEDDVYAQRFRSASLLIDGFESGDTSAWSATEP